MTFALIILGILFVSALIFATSSGWKGAFDVWRFAMGFVGVLVLASFAIIGVELTAYLHALFVLPAIAVSVVIGFAFLVSFLFRQLSPKQDNDDR